MPHKNGKNNRRKPTRSNQQQPRRPQRGDEIDDILLEYQQKAVESNHVNRATQQRQRRQPPTPPAGFEARWLETRIPAHPQDIKAELLLGLSVTFIDKCKADALYLYDWLLYRSPQCASGWYGKGEVLSKHSDPEGAIRCFRNALRFDPTLFCAADACIVEYGVLCDYDGLLKRGEEYLELARQVHSRSNRALCVRKVLSAVLECLTDGSRFSQISEGYSSQLAEVAKESPSISTLCILAKYMMATVSAKVEAEYLGTTVDIQTDELDGIDRERAKQAIMFFQKADAISFEDVLKDAWLETCFVGPHIDDRTATDAPHTTFEDGTLEQFQEIKRTLKGELVILRSMLGEEVVAAEDLLADGDVIGAATNCFFNDNHHATLELVDEHAGKVVPPQSVFLYHLGVRSIFKTGWYLNQSELTDEEVSEARAKLFKYCRTSMELESEVYATLAAGRSHAVRGDDPVSGSVGFLFASILNVHSRALWGIFVEAVETGDVDTAEEYFWRCWEFLKSRGADTSESLEFLRIVVGMPSTTLDVTTEFLMTAESMLTELQREVEELEEQEIAPQPDDDSPTMSKFMAELLKVERRLCVAIRREEATDRDEMEETTRRALKKAAWKEQVNQRRRSSPQGRHATNSASADTAAPPCRTTAEQRETMCRLLEHPATDAAAAVAVVDDEVLPQRSVLFPRAVASDAVLTFTHALRPLYLHVHEVAAQLFNLSDDGHSSSTQPEERSVTVLRRGKAAPQTIVEVLSSVIAACERGFAMRSSGLKSFSLPMTGVPDGGVWRRSGGEVPITEVVPSKGASLRVWGIQTAREVRLRFVAKDGFHRPIGDSYRFVDCVSNAAAFLDVGVSL